MDAIDSSVIVRGDVELADDVVIGPHCVLDATLGPVRIGPGTRLLGNAYLNGPLTMGTGNVVYPFTCIGFAPQSSTFDPQTPGCGVVINDHNVFREGVTVHRAMTDEGPTTIGSHNYFMGTSHVGHDVRMADHCTVAQGVALGGHVVVEERVTIGGTTPVHQFVQLGRGAMLGGGLAAPHDVAPFFMLTGVDVVGSINVVGMKRQGLPREQVEDIRWVYKTLYRRGLPFSAAVEALRQRRDRPIVAEYIAFIEKSKRGLTTGHSRAARNAI